MKLVRLEEMRKKMEKTKRQIAQEMNISEQSYGNYENGKREPGLSMLKKLAKYFGCSVDYIVEYDYADDKLTPRERTIIISYRQLDPDDADEVYEILRMKLKKKSQFGSGLVRSSW